MSSTRASASDPNLRVLESRIIAVLADSEDGVKANSFWTSFQNKHGYIPEQKKFGCVRRSQLLDFFSELFITVENARGEKILRLKQKTIIIENKSKSEEVAHSANKQQQLGKTRHVKELSAAIRNTPDKESKAVNQFAEFEEMSHKQPGSDFYSRFYRRQNTGPYQRDEDPRQAQGRGANVPRQAPDQGANAPLSGHVPSLMANYNNPVGIQAHSLQQNQHFVNHPPAPGHAQQWSGPAGIMPPPSNSNQSNSMFSEQNFPTAGTSGTAAAVAAATAAAEASETGHRVQKPLQKGVSPARRMNFGRDQMNTVADDCIERLSESKEYVSLERIEKLLLQHYSAKSLSHLNIRNLEELPCVNEHVRRECRVNLYIQMFIKTRAICTIYELAQCLKEFAPNNQDFEALRLGPLVKMPLVYQNFFAPSDKEICEIGTADVLEYLRCYLTDNNLWTNNKSSVEDFLKYMMEKRGFSSPYELGVRLKSLPLGIQVLKKGQRDCGQAIRDAISKLKAVAENDIDTAFRFFSSSILQKEPGICQVRQEYLRMPFADVLRSFFAKLRQLYRDISDQEASWELSGESSGTAKARRKEINKAQAMLNDLRTMLTKDVLLQRIMHIAICCSQEQIHEQLQSLFKKKDEDSSDESNDESGLENIPRKDELIATVIKYLDRCIAHGPLTLDKLSKIEERIIEDFNLKHFDNVNQGHFLQFLLGSEPVRKLLDESGGTLLGSSHAVGVESRYHATAADLIDFLTQCSFRDVVQHKSIEMAISHHYSVKDVKLLGHGCFSNLIKMAEKQQHPNHNCGVLYASALISKQFPVALAPDRTTGPLGHKTKEEALACLQSCPLLDDLALWSQWDLVFKPELKELKDFLQKYGGTQILNVTEGLKKKTMCTNILALEVRPGTLLKLTSDTSPEMFAKAAAARDVSGTCGHLVSLIALNRGIENTPLALLGNDFKTALLKIRASQPNETVYGMKKQRDVSEEIGNFVLECIVKMPLVIGHHVINQVFLEGLNFVIGQTKSKELLLSCALTTEQQSHLHALGILLGIRDWAECFQNCLRPPPDCIKDIDSNLSDIVTIESSDEDVESVSESDFSLSDDDEDDDDDDDGSSNENEEENSEANKVQQKKKIVSNKMKNTDAAKTLPVSAVKVEASRDQTEPIISLSESESDFCIEIDDEETAEVKPNLSDTKEDSESNSSAAVALADNEKELWCKNLIDQIRQEEFGFNVELNEDGTRLLTKQQERLGRSLERLSKDLYSKDTHFVLELIQNADDNEYPEDMMRSQLDFVPSVQFIVNCDSIVVYNNEVGFKEKNIRAICDVGRTTKGKHKFGYIGQKGIGFKSVFRVTNLPEIHSNGYHIQFDANSKPLGYILPNWLNREDRLIELPDQWTTCIALPLKNEMREQLHSLSLAARFRDIHPSLLLFLHRLRSIEVKNEVEGYVSKMKRNDIGEGVTEIEHQNGVDRWLVVRKTLDASQISLQAKSGIEVESTEIALAFPVMSKEMMAAKVLPDRQPVFAFLPLRSYGFRFVVQGDFDVPSSREEVDRDSMWNQWLRNEIHHVFVNALEVFKSHSEFDPVSAVSYFLQFVPSADEILDFFRPVAANILNQLKAKPCLPSQGLQWKLPSQLLICGDPMVREIVSGSLLRKHLGLDYLNRDVEMCLNPPLLESLGVQSLTTHHLIEVGKSIIANLNSPESEDISESIIKTSKWLLCVSRSMDEFSGNDDYLANLRTLPMIPLTNGKVVSVESQTLFFPLSTLEKEATRINLLKRLESDMQTVHPLLLGSPENVSSLQIIHLLQQLGVKKLTPSEVINHHILPALKCPDAESKPRDLLMIYILYIKEHYCSQNCMLDMNAVKEAAILLTNRGPRRPSIVPVHFTEAYDNHFSLQRCLPGYPWILIDSCYLQGSQFVRQVLEWKEFLKSLGVLDFLAVKQKKVILKPSELENSPWSMYKELLPDSNEYHILDSECEEFEALVKCNSESHSLLDQMKYLFEQLDRNWDALYKKHAITQVSDANGVPVKEVKTSFGILLTSLEWIPSKFEDSCKLANGCDLFVNLPETRQLMANHVAYIIPQMIGTSTFAQYLGIKCNISVDFVASQLRRWSDRKQNESQKPTSFESSVNHLKAVYEYLADNLPRKQIQDLFEHPVIFYPDMTSKDRGHFLMKREVRWSDPSGLFEKYHEALSTIEGDCKGSRVTINFLYQSIKNVFLDIARVQRKPDMNDYIELLIHISLTMPLQKALPDVLLVYSRVGEELSEKGDFSSEMNLEKVIALLQTNLAIPSKSGRWVGLDTRIMIADDKQLEKLFSDNRDVDFVDCGEKLGIGRARVNRDLEAINLDFVIKFLTSLGVEKLSSCIDIKSQTEMYQPCSALQQYVREVVPFVQRMLYCYPTIYDYMVKEKDIRSKLATMQFAQVAKLELIHSLRNLPDVPPVIFPQKCRLLNDQEMYVHRDCVDSYNDINRELARYFSCSGIPCPDDVAQCSEACFTKLKSFLGDILPLIKNKSPALDDLLEEHNLLAFPTSEEPWEVKEPIASFIRQPVARSAAQQRMTDDGSESMYEDEVVESNSEPTGLKSWPPQAPSVRNLSGVRTSGQSTTLMWPPPAPVHYVDRTNLPTNIRPSNIERDSDVEAPSSNTGENLQPLQKTDGSRTVEAHKSGTSENQSRQIPTGEKPVGKQEQVADVPEKDSGADNLVVTPGQNELGTARTETEYGLQHSSDSTTSPAGVGTRLASSEVRVNEPMVIEFSMPSTDANALARAGHKRARVSSGSASNDYVVPHTKHLITSHFYGPPIWLAQTDENIFIDLGSADQLLVPQNLNLNEDSDTTAIGVWGEALVKNFLEKWKLQEDSNIVEIIHVNQEFETGCPFDFIVRRQSEDSVTEVYIEVKTTMSNSKACFQISLNQLMFADKHGPNYHLYRVFSAGNPGEVRLAKIENLKDKMMQEKVRLMMII